MLEIRNQGPSMALLIKPGLRGIISKGLGEGVDMRAIYLQFISNA